MSIAQVIKLGLSNSSPLIRSEDLQLFSGYIGYNNRYGIKRKAAVNRVARFGQNNF